LHSSCESSKATQGWFLNINSLFIQNNFKVFTNPFIICCKATTISWNKNEYDTGWDVTISNGKLLSTGLRLSEKKKKYGS